MGSSSAPILITGFMAAGKTTIAAALARALDCSMIDLDQFIAEREGRSVPCIIDESGVEYFRRAETLALEAALESKSARVVALGGGTWTIARNRALIREHEGLTVWLDAPFELCWRRILRTGSTRPLAREREGALELFQTRRALYEMAALRVQVFEESNTAQIVAEIILTLSQVESKR
jgi:shikimate kinase